KNEQVVNRENIFKVVEVRNGKEKFVAVRPVEDYYLALKTGEIEKVKLTAGNIKLAQAPLKKGDPAVQMEVYLNDRLLRTIKLEYTENVESSSPFFYLKEIMRGYLKNAE
ncbi:MAG: hypothetical protein ACM3ZR_11735, partial [Pseudomonadota bacterium]